MENNQTEFARVPPPKANIVSLAMLLASVAFAEDFKTVTGKVYKDATIIHVEADGIVIRTKTGISKVYFVELPKDVQERFHHGPTTPAGKTITQHSDKAESANQTTTYMPDAADRFAQRVAEKLDERDSILQGKHTPGSAELMMIREFNFHKGFLAVIAIVAVLLFAIVWARFK